MELVVQPLESGEYQAEL